MPKTSSRKKKVASAPVQKEKQTKEVVQPSSSTEESIISALTGVLVGIVYWKTLWVTVPGGDSGELLAEACLNGVAHPPGYPLLIVSTNLWLQVCPIHDNPAHCANLLNAIFATCASIFVALSAHNTGLCLNYEKRKNDSLNCLSVRVVAATCSGLIFAFTSLVWQYSISFEVFALNNLILSALVFLSTHIFRLSLHEPDRHCGKRQACAVTGAFICGLGISNQHTSVLFSLPLVVIVFFRLVANGDMSVKLVTFLIVGGAVGLLPHLHLYYAGLHPSNGSWGDTGTLTGFLKHVLRQEYGTLRLSPMKVNPEDHQGMLERTYEYIRDTADQLGIFFFFVAFIGFAAHLKHIPTAFSYTSGQVAYVTVIPWVFYLAVFHTLANIPLNQDALGREVHRRFWMQPHIMVAIFNGSGIFTILGTIMFSMKSRTLAKAVGIVSICALLYHQMLHDRRNEWFLDPLQQSQVQNYGKSVLQSLPTGAIVLSHNDLNWNSVRYLQACKSMRDDVIHISLQLMPFPWFKHQQEPLYNTQSDKNASVVFPEILPTTSTERQSMENQRFITRFVMANYAVNNPRPIYLDLESVNFAHIVSGGSYANGQLRLIPEGLLWHAVYAANELVQKSRAELLLDFQMSQRNADQAYQFVHQHSLWPNATVNFLVGWRNGTKQDLQVLEDIIRTCANDTCHPGSWELAASSITLDALYQRGLYIITSVMEMREIKGKSFTLEEARGMYETVIEGFEILYRVSSTVHSSICKQNTMDVLKNTALGGIKILECSSTMVQSMVRETLQGKSTITKQDVEQLLDNLVNPYRELIVSAITQFVSQFPEENDAPVFRNVLQLAVLQQNTDRVAQT